MHLTHWSFVLIAALLTGITPTARAAGPEIISVKQIWEAGRHNAFTDLIRFNDQWLCTFREGDDHVGGDGTIRVLGSTDGERWQSLALISEPGVDLRDPKLSVTPDGRLHLVLGGSIYRGKVLLGRQPRVAFSKDGRTWSSPQKVLAPDDWLWRVTWHNGRAYGISYVVPTDPARKAEEWTVHFVESSDGVAFRSVTKLQVTGQPNEATVRFLENGDCVALLRRESGDRTAWIGQSRAPFTNWTWQSAGMQIGGPNFIQLPTGEFVAGGRQYQPAPPGAKMFLGGMTTNSVSPQLTLPSGGDCSYPGMVWHEGVLSVSYYSSHEGKSRIYLARIKW